MRADYLIVGADSQIGRTLHTKLRAEGRTVLGTTRREQSTTDHRIHLSLSDEPATWRLPERCEVTFLLAGVTSLSSCEADPDTTRLINVSRTIALARMMRERGSYLVFISTNLVLSGKNAYSPVSETLSPQCEYGRQKADVEQQLLASSTGAVLRITKVAESLLPLLRQWAVQLKQGQPIAPFSDLVCAPLAREDLIHALTRIADIRPTGLLHIGARPDVRYDEIALKLASFLDAPNYLVQPTTSMKAGFVLPARPRFTTLDTAGTEALLGLYPLDSKIALAQALASLP
jgi:dTDP-4-dehydrorhamnose reductase